MKTNKGLVRFATEQLNDPKNVYMLGGFGWILSGPERSGYHSVDRRIKNGCQHTIKHEAIIRKGIGGKAFDCVGLIKGYYWTDEISNRVLYKRINGVFEKDSDLGANSMYATAKNKGPIGTIPEVPGLIVWQSGHTGVYIGNGEVIEATPGFGFRVVKTQFRNRNERNYRGTWTNWFEAPYITYEKEEIMKYKVGDVVRVKGLAISSTATTNNNVTTHGEIRRVFDDGRKYPYLVGTAGWVYEDLILGLYTPEEKPDTAKLLKALKDDFNKRIDEILSLL